MIVITHNIKAFSRDEVLIVISVAILAAILFFLRENYFYPIISLGLTEVFYPIIAFYGNVFGLILEPFTYFTDFTEKNNAINLYYLLRIIGFVVYSYLLLKSLKNKIVLVFISPVILYTAIALLALPIKFLLS